MRTKVTVTEKEELLTHCQAINNILEKYPWFEPDTLYVTTTINRCKSTAAELLRNIRCLPTEEE